jgi:uncharacterized RmlC-like cupin family protein
MESNEVKVFNFNGNNLGETIQTAGMIRKEIFANDESWVGFVETEPQSVGGWHHHGNYNTFVSVISGSIVIDFGENDQKSVEARAGEAIYIPKGLVHREKNLSSEKGIVFVIRIGNGTPVININR